MTIKIWLLSYGNQFHNMHTTSSSTCYFLWIPILSCASLALADEARTKDSQVSHQYLPVTRVRRACKVEVETPDSPCRSTFQ